MNRIINRMVSACVVVLILGVLILAVSHMPAEPYLTNEQAIKIAKEYVDADNQVHLDQIMKEQYAYLPAKDGSAANSWSGQGDIWLTIKDGRAIEVNIHNDSDWAIWKESSRLNDELNYENPVFLCVSQNENCQMSAETMAALFSAAQGKLQGFQKP